MSSLMRRFEVVEVFCFDKKIGGAVSLLFPSAHSFCSRCVCVCALQVLCRRAGRWIRATQSVRSLRFFSTAGSSGSDEPYVAVSSHTAGKSHTHAHDRLI